MKIAMVSPYSLEHHGGVQIQASLLVDRLQAAGHEAWLVAPGTRGGPEGTVYLGDTVNVRANRSVAPIRLARGTKEAVGRAVAGAEVVHIHEPFMPAVSLGALSVPGPAKVGTFHADPGRGVRALYGLARRQWARVASDLAVAVAVSPVAAAAVEPIVGSVQVIPNAIDLSGYRSRVDKVDLRVAFLGRDDPRKGLDVLLRIWPEIQDRIPEAELIVMGTDRPDGGGVRFLGPVDDQQKRSELAEAGVFVAPNTGGESFGLVLLEAMASGCAVIASNLDSFRHVAGDAAVFATADDGPALSRALTTMLKDRAVRQEYRERAAERVKVFDVEGIVVDYLKVYAQAVDSSRG